MLGPTRKWEERRKLLTARAPTVRIDRCVVQQDEKGVYRVEIEGFGLRPAISPPSVTVGGQELEEWTWEPGGKRVSGILRGRPADDRVVVDLGYARTEGYVTAG